MLVHNEADLISRIYFRDLTVIRARLLLFGLSGYNEIAEFWRGQEKQLVFQNSGPFPLFLTRRREDFWFFSSSRRRYVNGSNTLTDSILHNWTETDDLLVKNKFNYFFLEHLIIPLNGICIQFSVLSPDIYFIFTSWCGWQKVPKEKSPPRGYGSLWSINPIQTISFVRNQVTLWLEDMRGFRGILREVLILLTSDWCGNDVGSSFLPISSLQAEQVHISWQKHRQHRHASTDRHSLSTSAEHQQRLGGTQTTRVYSRPANARL